MTDYPTRLPHDLLTQHNLDRLTADAANWRRLQAELAERGFDNMNVAAIAGCFPNFRAMAHDPRPLEVAGDHGAADTTEPARASVPPNLQAPPDAFLDAFLTHDSAQPSPKPLAIIQRTQPVDVREFAEAETTLGTVTVGFTQDAQLAFTFQNTHDVYLLPIINVLSDLMTAVSAATVARNPPARSGLADKPILSRLKKPTRLM